MPPVAPPPNGKDGAPARRSGRSVLSSSNADKDDFLCRVRYLNRLPDLPADPKFLQYTVDMAPYVKYTATVLEKEYKRDINCDSDMGMKLNLLTIQNHNTGGPDHGRDIDALLCADDLLNEPVNAKPARIDHSKHVAWLRKSQYILNDFAQSRAEVPAEKQLKKSQVVVTEFTLRTRISRMEAIQETFEYAQRRPKRHPNRPNLTVVDEMNIFPNFELLNVATVGVTFENDPAPPSTPRFTPDQVMANSMLRGMTDDAGNQLVAYFTPTDDSLQHLLETRELEHCPDEFAYKLHREFSLPADERSRQNKDEQVYALSIKDGVVAHYTDLETKVRLLRRARGTKKGKSKLLVRFRTQAEADEEARKAEIEALEETSDIEEQSQPEEPVSTRKEPAESSEDEEKLHEEESSDVQRARPAPVASSPSSSGSETSDHEGSPPKKISKTHISSDSEDDSD